MNERIKELAEQADIKFRISSIDPQFWSDKEESLEKFAELIIKECIAWVEDNNGHDGPSISEMKEHFGVEE